MVRIIHAAILLLAITDVRTQFFDFFTAFQPVYSTKRPFHLEVTTRRRTESKARHESTTRRNYNIDEDVHKQKQKQRTIAPIIFDFFGTTAKPVRKTTKTPRNNANDKANKEKTVVRQNHRDVDVQAVLNNSRGSNRETVSSSRRNQAVQNVDRRFNDGTITFDDDRNTVINYETVRPNYYDNKRFTTQNPFTSRPGVRPAVVNGPPITNKPPTRKPNFVSHQDEVSVTPELIIGPSEDYMTTVEKKRYIEMGEKMCDRYKELDIKQVEAIPLVPSPEPVRVNVSTCTPTTIPLIVGGRVATIQEFPHMALLGWNKIDSRGYSWKCGGSLISNQYILSAAHCAYQDRDDSVVMGPPRAVQLGSSFLDDPGAIVMKVAAVIRHPKYKLPKSYYDIALVKMVATVTFSNVIKPACLGVPPPPGRPVIATGWGRTEFGGDQSQELRSVSLSVWNMDECFDVLGTSRKLPNGPMSDSQICAGEKSGGKDTCQGDSGGPAQIQDGCSWRVVAVTSLGRSCGAPHTPALYAKIQRSFVSAVVFGGQTGSKLSTQSTNQQSTTQNNRNQNQPSSGWNSNSNTQQNPGWNSNNNNNQQNTGSNSNSNTRPNTGWNTNTNNNQPNTGWNTNTNNNQPNTGWNTNTNNNQPNTGWNTNTNNNQPNIGWNSNNNNQQWTSQQVSGNNRQNRGNNQQNGWNTGSITSENNNRNQNLNNNFGYTTKKPNYGYYSDYIYPYHSEEDFSHEY